VLGGSIIKAFTIRSKLVQCESLFSYLTRVAGTNGRDIVGFLDMVKRNEDYLLHSGDLKRIDFFPASMLNLDKLCEMTGLTRVDVNRSSFTNLIRAFTDSENGEKSKVLKGMLREDLHYCPECIAHTNSIYLHWKLIGVDVCAEHNKQLMNKCGHCHCSILYQDIRVVNRCPYCSGYLSKVENSREVIDQSNIKQQAWLIDNWKYLIEYTGRSFTPSEIAIKMVYILNDQQDKYNKELIRKSRYSGCLEYVIQCARGTLSKKCAVHITSLFSVLYAANLHVRGFLELNVPEGFIHSLHEKSIGEIAAGTACTAPWCELYGIRGELVSTGIFQSKKGGKSLSYFMVCPSCGCEYALDEDNYLVERSYFIKAYEILSNRNISKLTWPERIKVMGLKRGRIQRVLAYFQIRNVFDLDDIIKRDINEKLLEKFVRKLNEGIDLAEIRFWKEWVNYDQFLLHRYHPQVVQVLFESYTKPKAEGSDPIFRANIKNTCIVLLERDATINLPAVAKAWGTSATTIRNKGCSDIVEFYRGKQLEMKRGEVSMEIEQKVTRYLEEHGGEKVSMKELYTVTHTNYSLIRRYSPILIQQIKNSRRPVKDLV
jgi:hypothetical protein